MPASRPLQKSPVLRGSLLNKYCESVEVDLRLELAGAGVSQDANALGYPPNLTCQLQNKGVYH